MSRSWMRSPTHTYTLTHTPTHAYTRHIFCMNMPCTYLVQQCQIRVKFISSSHAACVAASGFVSNNLNCNRQTTCHIEEICHSAAAHSTSIQGKATPIDLTLLISLLFHFRVAPAPCLCCKRRKKTAQEVWIIKTSQLIDGETTCSTTKSDSSNWCASAEWKHVFRK